MRPLAPELLAAGTRPLAPFEASSILPADADAWDELATAVAELTDRTLVATVVAPLAAALDVTVDLDAELVVLQRSFGRLHRRAVTA